MLKYSRLTLFLLGALALTSGCMNRATALITQGADLGAVKAVYVVQSLTDDREVGKLIKDNMEKRGFAATIGPELPLPYKADAVVTYVDKWVWDITMYMLELTISIRNPTSNFPMANGNSLHASLTRKAPEEMVDEVLTNIFNEAKKTAQGGTK